MPITLEQIAVERTDEFSAILKALINRINKYPQRPKDKTE